MRNGWKELILIIVEWVFFCALICLLCYGLFQITAELILLLMTVLFAVYWSKKDATKLKNKVHIDHFKNAVIRGFVFVSFMFITNPSTILEAVSLFILQCAIFWIVFDSLIQHYRGKYWMTIGKTAYTDKFLRWITSWAKDEPSKEYYVFAFRLAVLLGSVFFYLKAYDYASY